MGLPWQPYQLPGEPSHTHQLLTPALYGLDQALPPPKSSMQELTFIQKNLPPPSVQPPKQSELKSQYSRQWKGSSFNPSSSIDLDASSGTLSLPQSVMFPPRSCCSCFPAMHGVFQLSLVSMTAGTLEVLPAYGF